MLDSMAIVLISVSLSGITTYIVGKLLARDVKKGLIAQIPALIPIISDIFLQDIEEYVQTTDGAKFVYGVGALIGNGAKQGLGMNTKGGKFKFENIFGQIAAGFIQQYMPGITGATAATPQQNTNKEGLTI